MRIEPIKLADTKSASHQVAALADNFRKQGSLVRFRGEIKQAPVVTSLRSNSKGMIIGVNQPLATNIECTPLRLEVEV